MSCHLMFMAPGPPERETILLLSSLSCHCCLLSVSTPIRSLISSSDCQFPKAARSATKIILGWLSSKAVTENPPRLFTVSAAPSLHFSVSPRKITGEQLHHGQGELGSPAGAQQVRRGKAMDPGCHQPQPHQQPPTYTPVWMPQVLPRITGCFPDTLWVTRVPGDPS